MRQLFGLVHRLEDEAIKASEFSDLSRAEISAIMAIGTGRPKTMTHVANILEINVSTLTRLTTMYNRKFNCFVRPKYDGSHQTFPDLNLKGLASRGIQSVYPSQKDCVWMIKQNGGGICDQGWPRPLADRAGEIPCPIR